MSGQPFTRLQNLKSLHPMPINTLVIGSGAREDALGWKLKQSPLVGKIFFAPGNPGTARHGENVPIQATHFTDLLRFAKEHNIELTVVGPEDPLIEGIVDLFQANGLRIFGPTKKAAQIEGSKAFAKQMMKCLRIPSAEYQVFDNYDAALEHVRTRNSSCFVKASGPALGKGAIPCVTADEAEAALKALMIDKVFGSAGETVVIEDFLQGDEYSAHAICDKHNVVLFPFARDHKRARDNDEGDNTGGMGTIAPVPVTPGLEAQTKIRIIEGILETLAMAEIPYNGLLFPGIMQTNEGPRVLEFNARFGDPETEVFMKLLDSDLVELLMAAADNRLADVKVRWKPGSAACVIMASGGYPGKYKKGFPITGIKDAEQVPEVTVFHSGTALRDEGLATNGGRVLAVTAYGDDLHEALRRAYEAVYRISFEDMQFRTDIGKKTLEKLASLRQD